MKTKIFTAVVTVFAILMMAGMVLADNYIGWSVRSECGTDDQNVCSCFNYAAIEFSGDSEGKIPTLSIVLDGKNVGSITSQYAKPKKGMALENMGSQYYSAIPIYSAGGYNLELKNGRKIWYSDYVEIPELEYYLWDISAGADGNVNVVIDITPLFGTEVPTGAASIKIVDVVGKLGTISTGDCGDYLFSFSLSRDEMNILRDSEVTVEFNIAGNYYYSTMYFWSPYNEDYQNTQAKVTSMTKAKKINKTKIARVR